MNRHYYNNSLSYEDFVRNLIDIEVKSFKMDIYYTRGDSRCWTAILNQGKDNILVTYHYNKDYLGHQCIDILSSERSMIGIEPEYVYDIIEELVNKTSTVED